MIIIKTLKTTLAAMVLALSVSVAQAGSFDQLVAFGDSLSDTGNITSMFGIPLAPYAVGRFSNGPVWIDRLASNLRLSSLNSQNGGTNYAWGGATSGPGSTNLLDQATTYLTDVGGVANLNGLYSIWIGGNDVLDAAVGDPIAAIADQAAANVSSVVTDLAAAGAMTFLVPNLPDIGLTPSSSGDSALATYRSDLTAAYNLTLAMTLGSLESSLGVNIIAFDVAALFAQLVTDPDSFGFTNAIDKCWTGTVLGTNGIQCSEPNSYVFWDDVHPTAAAHAVLGDMAFSQVVPIPAAVWLFGSALLGLIGIRKRAA